MSSSKRTLFLAVLFLILAGLSVTYFAFDSGPKTTMLGADRQFAVPDTQRIYKIFLADREGERVTLERKDGYWLYNGQWKARPTAMKNLLEAIARVRMKYKPPQAMVNNMISSLAGFGIKVELYDRHDKLIKAYYVGGATPDERGVYMIMENAEQPYVVHMTNWEGNLRMRFKLKGDDWRDRSIFAERPENIAAVSVEYPKQRDKSFRLEKSQHGYSVKPYYEINEPFERPLRAGAVETYLLGFERLGAEAFENNNPRRDSVLRTVPFSVITVRDMKGAEKIARLFPIYYHREDVDMQSGQVRRQPYVDRYFVDLSTGDFMLAQNRVLKDVLWGYSFFFE
jgi:hypothetical protein